jgi:hypothetical protein
MLTRRTLNSYTVQPSTFRIDWAFPSYPLTLQASIPPFPPPLYTRWPLQDNRSVDQGTCGGLQSGLCPFAAHGSRVTASASGVSELVPVDGSWCPMWKEEDRFSSFRCEVEVPHLVRLCSRCVGVARKSSPDACFQGRFLSDCHQID